MDKEIIKQYQAELQNAMNKLKSNLAESQHIIGVVESFIYLIGKESAKAMKELEKPIQEDK